MSPTATSGRPGRRSSPLLPEGRRLGRAIRPLVGLASLLTRIEAEFAGRLLIGPEDLARWRDDPDGLTWGLIGVEGFDSLVRTPDDLNRLSALFNRGVRLFQPVYGPANGLGGSSAAGDDRGLTDLGGEFVEALLDLNPESLGPRPILDLAPTEPDGDE